MEKCIFNHFYYLIWDIYHLLQRKREIAGGLKLLKSNKQFRNSYSGKRCFIIGNGPSLNALDLSLLRDEYTFTVNQLSKNTQFPKIKTTFHFWSDSRFFEINKNDDGDLALLESMKNVKTEGNSPIVFYSIDAFDLIKKEKLDDLLDIHYFAQCNLTRKKYIQKGKFDMTKMTANFSTVIHECILCAIYMGFTEIYLLGVDCTGFITTAEAKMRNYTLGPQYAFEIGDAERKRLERTNNRFSMKQELKNYFELFEDYEYFSEICKRKGIKLFNCTPGGLLESIERVDFLSVVGKKDY